MNTENYAAPQADLTHSKTDIDQLLEPLAQTRPWVLVCSILGFIATFFMAIGSIGIMFASSSFHGMPPGFGVGMGFAYLVGTIIFFFMSYHLVRYAGAIKKALTTTSSEDITQALTFQKSFWKLVGIVSIIYVIFILGFIAFTATTMSRF